VEPQDSKHRRHLTQSRKKKVSLDVTTCESNFWAVVVTAEHAIFGNGYRFGKAVVRERKINR
jgi:hypothetical protein